MHGGAISDARLYNRSLMSQAGMAADGNLPAPPGHPPNLPPLPPARGMSSYNGVVRAGSFASFGHPSQHFAAVSHLKKLPTFFGQSCCYLFKIHIPPCTLFRVNILCK